VHARSDQLVAAECINVPLLEAACSKWKSHVSVGMMALLCLAEGYYIFEYIYNVMLLFPGFT